MGVLGGEEIVNFRTLDLNLLRVFDAVMLERNVTRAADRLAMTQPAASNALRRLREALGEELFDTSPTGMVPTPRAMALWPAVRQALGALRDELDPQGFDPRHDERRFRLQMADATAAVQVRPLIEQMVAGPWRVGLSLEPLTTRDPRSQLDRGMADAAVGFFPDVARRLAAAAGSSEFVLDPMYECEYVAVMRRSHPLARAAVLTLDDYVHADHVRVSFAGRAHGFVDEALSRLNLERRVPMVVGHFATASQALRHADLLCVLPRSYVDVSDDGGDLVVRDLPFEMPRIEVGLLWHRRHERDAGHRWLRQTVARCVPSKRSIASPSTQPALLA
jgi:DNA-binding transcriptional LysR family regulator